MELMGGEQRFISKLDSLFTMHLPDEFFAHTEDVTKEGLLGGYVHGKIGRASCRERVYDLV